MTGERTDMESDLRQLVAGDAQAVYGHSAVNDPPWMPRSTTDRQSVQVARRPLDARDLLGEPDAGSPNAAVPRGTAGQLTGRTGVAPTLTRSNI